jgi:hypothetical protein
MCRLVHVRNVTAQTSTLTPGPGPGLAVKKLRIAGMLTRQRLADLAGVPLEHVILFEQNLPVPLESRRRIYRELWSRKTKK